MTIRFIYCQEPYRVIPAVLIDARKGRPDMEGRIGADIKAATDAATITLGPPALFYKLETLTGNIAGFLSVTLGDISQNVTKFDFVLRPAFQQFTDDIKQQITYFISSNGFRADFL